MRTYGETSHPNQDHGARGTARPRPSVTREVRGSKKNVLPGLLLIQDSDRIINLDIVWWWIMERPHKRPREALAGESTSTPPGMPGRCLGQKLGWVEGHGTESDRTGWCRSQREIGFKDAGPSGERVAMPSQRSHIACSSALSCDTTWSLPPTWLISLILLSFGRIVRSTVIKSPYSSGLNASLPSFKSYPGLRQRDEARTNQDTRARGGQR